MNVINNVRFKSTQEKIKEALFRLLKRRKFNDISVKDVYLEAGINKSTFYSHYQDINDLMIKIENDISANVSEIFNKPEINRDSFVEFFNFVKLNKDFYGAYLQLNESSFIERETFFDFRKIMLVNKTNSFNDNDILYHMAFFGGGIKAICKFWVLSGCKESASQMANIIFNQYSKNAKFFLTEQN